jgi:hypothetical protein
MLRAGRCVVAQFAETVLNNAVVFRADTVATAEAVCPAGAPYALWCLDDARPTAGALTEHGYRMSETTRPMVCLLDDVTTRPDDHESHEYTTY